MTFGAAEQSTGAEATHVKVVALDVCTLNTVSVSTRNDRKRIRSEYATLAASLISRSKVNVLLVAIDGFGGSGKSTFAGGLARQDSRVRVVHMDDFYDPLGGNSADAGAFDWRRLTSHVLEPLSRGEAGRYQRFDWPTRRLAEWIDVPARGVVLIEGVTSMRHELSGFYGYQIWVDCPYELRLMRGVARDGEAARDRWVNAWMPAEERYFRGQRPDARADLMVDGSGTEGGDGSGSFLVIEERNGEAALKLK